MNSLEAKGYVLQLARTIAADGIVDERELRRIYEVMAAFELGADTRAEILDLLYFNNDKLNAIEVNEDIVANEEIRIALAKDVLFLKEQDDGSETDKMARGILSALEITSEQLDFLQDWVAWENKALRRLGAGEMDLADEGSLKELSSRAASVGVPLSALYFAGSVVGFSAVGITSGLATLGSASGLALLGLNPMTAGIAALIIAGVSVKKLWDFGFKANKKKQVEVALQQAKLLQQRYRKYLLHDMTEFEKGSIIDWFSGKSSKRKKAIETFHRLLAESLQQRDET